MFDNFEKLLLEASKREGERPSASNLPDDNSEINMRTRIDEATGLKTNEFFAKESFIKSMGREGQRVLRFLNPKTGDVLFWSSVSAGALTRVRRDGNFRDALAVVIVA